MIPAGTCFCHRCGSVFQDAYYKSGLQNFGVKLKRPAHSIGDIQWKLEPFTPDPENVKIDPDVEIKLTQIGNVTNGVPEFIKCTFGKNTEPIRLVRSCPVCKEDTALVKDCGRYPTFVVVMVGARTTGKTVWLKAIATDVNLYEVNKNTEYAYEIDFYKKFSANDFDLVATPKESEGATNYLYIKKKDCETPVAAVILLDAAGELFLDLSLEHGKMSKFLLGDGDYTGVDAIIQVESAELAAKEDKDRSEWEMEGHCFKVYEEMNKLGLLHHKPVAFVYTHTDKLLKDTESMPRVWDMAKEEKVPMFSQSTFGPETSYEPKLLRARFLQEDVIARSINMTVLKHIGTNRQGFMIQTCVKKVAKDGQPRNDYRERFNVMDPLLWILNNLRLFPIPEE